MMGTAIGIVEDDQIVRESLSLLINGKRGYTIAFTAESAEQALERLETTAAALVIVDLGLPLMSGVDFIQRLRTRHPETMAIVFTVFEDDQSLFNALRRGAVGYLTKDTPPEKLLDAVEETLAGGAPMSPGIARRVVQALATEPTPHRSEVQRPPLTHREQEVLQQLAQGYTYLNVATTLGLSTHTVHTHIRNIYKKLTVSSRSEAVYEGIRRNLVNLK